jgi:hypothetical protein
VALQAETVYGLSELSVRSRRHENDINAIYAMLAGIKETVDLHTITLAQHTVRLDRIEIRLDRIETRLDGVETTQSQHTGLLQEILRRLPEPV